MNRRALLAAALAAAGCSAWGASRPVAALAAGPAADAFAALEEDGRLGVHVIDTATGREYGHRSDERFLMLSTFKTLACAHVLYRVDARDEKLDRRIRYTEADLVSWSPITSKHAGGEGLTLGELCAATITTSDNTAANLILATLGGPAALTSWLRRVGDDEVTRLDRLEPDLNTGSADRLLDTTTPRAMARTVRRLLLGEVLSAESRRQLEQWLLANTTGDRRLRAGTPAGWRVAEKTGTSDTGANDVGVLWPPGGGAPIVVAVYVAESRAAPAQRDERIAAVARRVTTGR